MEEIWKDIKNYEGLYQVSNFGNVKSLGNGLSNNSKNKLLKVFNWGTHIERVRKQLINGKKSKPVLQYDLEGNFIKEWPSVMEIERTLNYANSNISACCLNKYKQAYGYIWKYKMAG